MSRTYVIRAVHAIPNTGEQGEVLVCGRGGERRLAVALLRSGRTPTVRSSYMAKRSGSKVDRPGGTGVREAIEPKAALGTGACYVGAAAAVMLVAWLVGSAVGLRDASVLPTDEVAGVLPTDGRETGPHTDDAFRQHEHNTPARQCPAAPNRTLERSRGRKRPECRFFVRNDLVDNAALVLVADDGGEHPMGM
eukprot:1460047-Prymnesium_polylepis.1